MTATGAGAASAPVAQPAKVAVCKLTVHLPSRVSLTKSTTKIHVTLTGCKNNLSTAGTELTTPQGHQWWPLGWTNAHRSVTVQFAISDAPPIGTYRINKVLEDAFEKDKTTHPTWTNAPTTVVKLGSKAGISTSRKGSKVTISSKVSHFSSTGWKAYTHKVVGFQVRAVGSKTWKTIGFGKTSSTGRVSLRHTAAHSAYYRMSVGSTSRYWGSTSGSSRR